jgi:hypothetical protein
MLKLKSVLFVLTDQSDAQTTAAVSQCCVCIFLWQPDSVGSNTEAVQHQGQVTELFVPVVVGAIVACE